MSSQSLGWFRSFCVVAALSAAVVMTVAATAERPASAPATQAVSLAGGKLQFTLKSVERRSLPGDSTMYFDEKTNQAIIVTEGPLPVDTGDASDKAFDVAVETLKEKQHAASPNFQVVGEQTTPVNGLKVYQLDATDDVNGMQLLMATMMAVNDRKIAVIEVMSDVKDPAGHAAAVKNILGK